MHVVSPLFVEIDTNIEIRRQMRHLISPLRSGFSCVCSTADPGCLDIWTSLSSEIPLSDNKI